jgi:GTPase SAR1 family protein
MESQSYSRFKNESSNSFLIRKVLILGEMGKGKSSFCVSLSGDRFFKVSAGRNAC